MATRHNTNRSNNLLTAITAAGAGDNIYLDQWPDDYDVNVDISANDIGSFTTLPGWSGSIGDNSGTRLKITCSAGAVRFNSRSRLINFEGVGTIPTVESNLVSGGQLNIHGSGTPAITDLICPGGFTRVFDTQDANNIWASGHAQVQLDESANVTAAYYGSGSSSGLSERPLTALRLIDSASFTVRKSVAPSCTVLGGTLKIESDTAPTLVECADCVLDFSAIRISMTTGGNPTFGDNVTIIQPTTPGVTVTIGGTVKYVGRPPKKI